MFLTLDIDFLNILHSGVEKVSVDINQDKVTVQGSAAPEKVLKRVKKAGKHARFWPQVHHKFSAEHVNNANLASSSALPSPSKPALPSPSKSCNMVNDVHFEVSLGTQSPHRPGEEDITTLFSDENPNACSLM